MDRRYLRRIAEHHAGGPVGVETLAAALAEARDTLEDVVEPFLIQEGLVLRTSRGRMLGEPGWRHLGLAPPPHGRKGSRPARSAAGRWMNQHPASIPPEGRHSLCRPGLLRGHRCRRHRLPRHLSALRRARPDRSPARPGHPACRARAAMQPDVRGAAHRSGLSACRPTRRFAGRGDRGRWWRAAPRRRCARRCAGRAGPAALRRADGQACVCPASGRGRTAWRWTSRGRGKQAGTVAATLADCVAGHARCTAGGNGYGAVVGDGAGIGGSGGSSS